MRTCNLSCLQLYLLTIESLRSIIHPYSIFTVIYCNNGSGFGRIAHKRYHAARNDIPDSRFCLGNRSRNRLRRRLNRLDLNIIILFHIHDKGFHITRITHFCIKSLHQLNDDFYIADYFLLG